MIPPELPPATGTRTERVDSGGPPSSRRSPCAASTERQPSNASSVAVNPSSSQTAVVVLSFVASNGRGNSNVAAASFSRGTDPDNTTSDSPRRGAFRSIVSTGRSFSVPTDQSCRPVAFTSRTTYPVGSAILNADRGEPVRLYVNRVVNCCLRRVTNAACWATTLACDSCREALSVTA